MAPENLRLTLIVSLVFCSGLLLAFPVEPVLSTEAIFDDEADKRIREESIGNTSHSQLILTIRHDDGGSLTGDFDLVEKLMQLEKELMDGSNSSTSWDEEHVFVSRVETPYSIWADAFASRNRSLENATEWHDVLLPQLDEGWCGNGTTEAEKQAFEATLLMLPKDANLGIACPAFSGANADQAPDTDELLWLVWLESNDEDLDTDWGTLDLWAQKVSASTEFEVSAAGVNMLFAKSKTVAEDDLKFVLFPSIIILAAVMMFALRDLQIVAVTLGGVGLAICAEAGLLSALGFTFSVIDGIALPIILAVAVDGAFWYCKSSRKREEVRSMLLMALGTTLAAISLSLFSPIKAQRSLALVMAIGIILCWAITRYVLEDIYLRKRAEIDNHSTLSESLTSNPMFSWSWPVALLLLASIAVISPPGVEVFDVEQFLPENDPTLDELKELQTKYVLASSTIAWVVVDVDGDSEEDLNNILDLQKQLGSHPSVISFETGLLRTPMVLGIQDIDSSQESPTIDSVSDVSQSSAFVEDARLQRNGVTTGVAIAVLIDGQNADAALQFLEDVEELLESNGFTGIVGGDLPIGASLARSFEDTRVTQIVAAGCAVFAVSVAITNSPKRAMRIAIGTIAIGAAVDGMASIVGVRGVITAPVVLLGMGFAADYLSHASVEHIPTRKDTFARWGAAITSISVFVLLGLTSFPPARNTGNLLSLSILFSVVLASCLAMTHNMRPQNDSEE
jgi:predicted RND superfamily exporter protein